MPGQFLSEVSESLILLYRSRIKQNAFIFRSICQVLDDKLKEIVDDTRYLFEEIEKTDDTKTASSQVDFLSFY